MTPEELLKPRYKVIADWPGRSNSSLSEMVIGYVALLSKEARHPVSNNLLSEKLVWQSENGMRSVGVGFFDLYPHLFQPLHWWEDRNPEDLPKYLKSMDGKHIKQVIELTSNGFRVKEEKSRKGYRTCDNNRWLPATLEEYATYINSL